MTYLLPATSSAPLTTKSVFSEKIKHVLSRFQVLFSTQPQQSQQSQYSSIESQTQSGTKRKININFKRFFRNKRFLTLVGIIVIAIVGTIVVRNVSQGAAPSVLPTSDKRVEIEKPKQTQELNRTFLFPLRDGNNKEVSKIQYLIESAEIRDELVVQGKKATSVKGRTFLVLNIKITNNFNQSLQINSRDYVRLVINGTVEKVAADIHNDPVDVQAISTKSTRLAFPIDEQLKPMSLQIGEINGAKETVVLGLK